MATKLGLYNGALGIMQNRFLDTVTDDIEDRYCLDKHYDKVLEWCLEQGFWNFASRLAEVDAEAVTVPTFGHSKAFTKPTDWVRTVRISANEALYPTMEDSEYLDEGGYWFASVDPLYIQYVSNDDSYGLLLAQWPATFERMVEFELAVRCAPHLTAMSRSALGDLRDERNQALKDARSKDAMNQGAMRPPPGRLTRSRHSSRTGNGQAPWWR